MTENRDNERKFELDEITGTLQKPMYGVAIVSGRSNRLAQLGWWRL